MGYEVCGVGYAGPGFLFRGESRGCSQVDRNGCSKDFFCGVENVGSERVVSSGNKG